MILGTTKLAAMAKRTKIYHRNDARSALASLKLSTRRILYLTIVQQEKDESGNLIFCHDKKYTITAKQYAELCDVDESVAYKQLKDGVRDIRTHLMEISESQVIQDYKKSNDRVIVFTVANHGVYSDGGGYVEIKLDPIMAPYISNLTKNFTGQFLLSGLRIPDSNANRLYLLLREWISSGCIIYKEITVAELKEKLLNSANRSYDEFKTFKQFFWGRAVKKILESSEFSKIDMKIIERKARRAHVVRITYEYDEQKKHLKDAGFMIGTDKKSKAERVSTKDNKDNSEGKIKREVSSDVLKQINGRFYDKKTADAAGYNWDEY